MRTNVWLTVENNLAVGWWDWYQWFVGGQDGPEPPITDWDRRALQKTVDIPWTAKAFKKATIPQLAPKDQWRLWNLYDVKVPEWIDAGYAQHGKAEEGGDLGVAGNWVWKPEDPQCLYDDHNGEYPWKPNQVLLFMPDVCSDPPDCTTYAPATKVIDVSMVFSQPPREFPSQPT